MIGLVVCLSSANLLKASSNLAADKSFFAQILGIFRVLSVALTPGVRASPKNRIFTAAYGSHETSLSVLGIKS